MGCRELEKLREHAIQLRQRLTEQRSKAKANLSVDRGRGRSGRSEMEPFLLRKLEMLTSKINDHLREHACDD